jgi:hypothetical protein
MSSLKERLFKAMQNPRVAQLLSNPGVQSAVVRAFRFRGRVEAAVDRKLEQMASRLNLATQKDVRTLQRRIRQLERELREADERLIDSEPDREAPGRS